MCALCVRLICVRPVFDIRLLQASFIPVPGLNQMILAKYAAKHWLLACTLPACRNCHVVDSQVPIRRPNFRCSRIDLHEAKAIICEGSQLYMKEGQMILLT